MNAPLVLVSHVLCPYVQRACIVLAEKEVPFVRKDIDLAHKPQWFLELSPLGKTPVLMVGEQAIFESTVICEYLDETYGEQLHPRDALRRARHRGWMEFGSGVLNLIAAYYSAADEEVLLQRGREIKDRLAQLEAVLGDGDFFDGPFSLVDAVFAPVFRYFDVLDETSDVGFFTGLTKLGRWRAALDGRMSVQRAVRDDYRQQLRHFFASKPSALGRRIRRDLPGAMDGVVG
jgi:glutathione S-transferase